MTHLVQLNYHFVVFLNQEILDCSWVELRVKNCQAFLFYWNDHMVAWFLTTANNNDHYHFKCVSHLVFYYQKNALLRNFICAFSAAVSIFYGFSVLLCLGSSFNGFEIGAYFIAHKWSLFARQFGVQFSCTRKHIRRSETKWKKKRSIWVLFLFFRVFVICSWQQLRKRTKFCTIFYSAQNTIVYVE